MRAGIRRGYQQRAGAAQVAGPPAQVLTRTTLRATFGVEPGLFAALAATLAGGAADEDWTAGPGVAG